MRRAKGEGSVTQRKDDRWQARYQANGERKYIYGSSRRDVARNLTEALSEFNKGLVYDDKGITLTRHLEGWLTSSKNSVRVSTWERYEQICRKHIIPELGHLRIGKLTPAPIQNRYQEKLQVLSPRTVQYIHVTLHRSLSQALRWNLVPRNVAELVDPPRVTKKEIRPLTQKEAKFLFEAVNGNPLETSQQRDPRARRTNPSSVVPTNAGHPMARRARPRLTHPEGKNPRAGLARRPSIRVGHGSLPHPRTCRTLQRRPRGP